MKKTLSFMLLLACLFTSMAVKAQESSYESISGGIVARYGNEYIRFLFYNDSTLRVSKSLTGDYGQSSWAIIAEPDANVNVNVSGNDVITLSSAKLSVQYNSANGRATIFDNNGRQLLAETSHSFTATTDGQFASYTLTQSFQLDNDERIYGMGQLQDGLLNRRGTYAKLVQENCRITIPYFLSSKNYGFYWENYSPTVFDDTGSETLFRSTGKVIDYYVLAASSSHDVQRSLRHMTGQTELPPLWNFGLYHGILNPSFENLSAQGNTESSNSIRPPFGWTMTRNGTQVASGDSYWYWAAINADGGSHMDGGHVFGVWNGNNYGNI